MLVLGPLVARFGRARCRCRAAAPSARARSISTSRASRRWARSIRLEHGYVDAERARLRGAEICFDMPTVTGTENLMMAAALAKGRTTLENAAREPEVEELGRVLNKMGASIDGARAPTSSTSRARRAARPSSTRSSPTASRRARSWSRRRSPGGDVLVRDARSSTSRRSSPSCARRASRYRATATASACAATAARAPVDVTTAPHPGFPTDMQAQFMVLMTHRARAKSVITETIFENRFMHVPELVRMGADIRSTATPRSCAASTRSRARPSWPPTCAPAPRWSSPASSPTAETEVLRVYHLDRGYEHIEKKLAGLGADVVRVRGEGLNGSRHDDRSSAHHRRPQGADAESRSRRSSPKPGIDASAAANRTIAGSSAQRLTGALRFLLLKPDDVPTYVEYGAADLGVSGRDVLLERRYDLYQPLDLGIGRCRMVVAAPIERGANARRAPRRHQVPAHRRRSLRLARRAGRE